MVLVLAVHNIATASATVPFAAILLKDFIQEKKYPESLGKCRQMIASSGSTSVSLWDVSDPDELLAWLIQNITVDVKHEVFQVQEEFSIGLGQVFRDRAAERVATGTKDVVKAVGHQAQELDHKLKISERAGHAVEVVRDSAVMQSTAAAFQRAGSSVKTATTKVLDQPAVASATEAVGTGFKKLGQSLSSLTGKALKRSSSPNGSAADNSTEYLPPVEPPQVPSSVAPTVGGATITPVADPPSPAFTLEEDEAQKQSTPKASEP